MRSSLNDFGKNLSKKKNISVEGVVAVKRIIERAAVHAFNMIRTESFRSHKKIVELSRYPDINIEIANKVAKKRGMKLQRMILFGDSFDRKIRPNKTGINKKNMFMFLADIMVIMVKNKIKIFDFEFIECMGLSILFA